MSGTYCYEAAHQQSRRDGGRREGGGGYRAIARFTREGRAVRYVQVSIFREALFQMQTNCTIK